MNKNKKNICNIPVSCKKCFCKQTMISSYCLHLNKYIFSNDKRQNGCNITDNEYSYWQYKTLLTLFALHLNLKDIGEIHSND